MKRFDTIALSKLKLNPDNPRLIKDDKYKKLVKSIKEFPKMLQIRPIVVNDDMIVLGGNQRLAACKEAKLKQIPYIKASELTEEEQIEFIAKDNISFGEWDWDIVANEWNLPRLIEWGQDIPAFDLPTSNIEEDKEIKIKITNETSMLVIYFHVNCNF